MRSASISRTTRETDISVEVNLDGTGKSNISTGVGFFDHMLDQIARHSLIDLTIKAKGDLHIETLYGENDHHISESCFKGLARALRMAVSIDQRQSDRVPSTKGTLSA